MYCRFCGKEISDDAIFCQYCGKKLEYNPDEANKEEIKKEVVDENYKTFKKNYTKGALPGLIWFGALNVIGSTFLAIGYLIVAMIFIAEGNDIHFSINDIMGSFSDLFDKNYFIIVPIMYTIGYLIASILAMIIGKRIVYGKKEERVECTKNISKLSIKELIIVILVAFGLWGIGVVIGNLPSFFIEEDNSQIEMIFGKYTVIYLIQAMFCAPIIEEYFFRKLLIDKVANHGEGLAILTSALLFGLMHGNLGQFFLAFLLGLLFAIIYIKTRNIKYTMAFHFMINTVASLPEIFMLFGIDISLGWYIGIGVLVLAGIIVAIIFRKSAIFKINKECEYDGYLIHKAAGFEVFFIVTLVTLASTTLSGSVVDSFDGFNPLSLLELVPIGAFVAFIVLYNHQVHHIFKGTPKDPTKLEYGLEQAGELEASEVEELNKLDE